MNLKTPFFAIALGALLSGVAHGNEDSVQTGAGYAQVSEGAAPVQESPGAAIPHDGAPVFEEIDANADGTISIDESKNTWLAEVFTFVDVNGDGHVTKSEYDEATG